MSKMSDICAIVRDKINNIYERMQEIERKQKQIERLDVDYFQADKADYKTKNKKNTNKFDDMW